MKARHHLMHILTRVIIALLLTATASSKAGENLDASRTGSVAIKLPTNRQINFGHPLLTLPITADSCRKPDAQTPALSRATIIPLTRRIGEINGNAVYEIPSTPGIGWMFSLKAIGGADLVELNSNRPTEWYPATNGLHTRSDTHIRAVGRLTYVATGNSLAPGAHIIPPQDLAHLACFDKTRQRVDTSRLNLSRALTFTLSAATCTVTTPRNDTLDFGEIKTSDFPDIGSTSPLRAYRIGLECSPGMVVSATASDQTKLGNRSDVVSLSADSTAAGLGVQVVNPQGQPYSLGPDTSRAATQNQFYLFDSNEGGSFDVPLGFRYVRTGELKAGTANALIGITFSYE